MKRRTRRVLFWIAVIVFGCISWVVVKYAQGYVYDWHANTFVRTGALSVTVNANATLSINNQKVGTTSLLSNTVGQSGLKPGTYTIQIDREGYSTWRKTAIVQEGLLTSFPHAMILPTDEASIIDLEHEASGSFSNSVTLRNVPKPKKPALPEIAIDDFLLRGTQLLDMRTASASFVDSGVLGVATTSGRILWWTSNEVWVLWLGNTNEQPYRTEGEKEMIMRFATPIARAAWFRDNDHIVVDLGSRTYRVIEIDTRGGVNIIRI